MLTDLILMTTGSVLFYLLFFIVFKKHGVSILGLCVYYAFLWHLFPFEPYLFSSLFLLSGLSGFVGSLLLKHPRKNQEKLEEDSKKAFLKANVKSVIPNIYEGIFVSGAAGSGKTESVIYRVLKHYARHKLAGIIYDYKNFELTEIAYALYQNKPVSFHCLCFHDTQRSSRINPIAPKYIQNEDSLRNFWQLMYENITQSKDKSNPFFKHASVSTVAALSWKLYQDDPDRCTIPFITGLFTQKDLNEIAEMIQSNPRARALGSMLLDAMGDRETSANIKASISSFLNFFLTPEKFYVLGKDELNLSVNSKENKAVVCLINDPASEHAYSPVLSAILEVSLKAMSQREREPSFLLLDEAPTLKLQNISRVPATLRSYKVSILYALQDKSLSDETQGDTTTRAVLSNLSSLYIGKVNDERSAKMFEAISEIQKQPQRSINRSSNWLTGKGETRVNTSEREIHKIRAHEFFKFKAGVFYNFCRGEEKKLIFPYEAPKKIKPPKSNLLSDRDLEEEYIKVLREAQEYSCIFRKG